MWPKSQIVRAKLETKTGWDIGHFQSHGPITAPIVDLAKLWGKVNLKKQHAANVQLWEEALIFFRHSCWHTIFVEQIHRKHFPQSQPSYIKTFPPATLHTCVCEKGGAAAEASFSIPYATVPFPAFCLSLDGIGYNAVQMVEYSFCFPLQNVSALDLASLSDNAPVATYIARLLESLGYDPNEPNKQGHTVLHLLARKGDDCSDTLERLLKMKKTSNPKERLFRIDVINKGRKTPLDVAATCSHMFSTGKDRAVYTQTINHFQDVIIDEAEGLMNLWFTLPLE